MSIPVPYNYHALSGVAGDTLLLTREATVFIDTLVGQSAVEVWNGTQWMLASVIQVLVNQPLFLVTLSDGRSLTCGASYPWYIRTPSFLSFDEVKTAFLTIGSAIWWTTLDTDLEGAPPASFPTIVSVAPLGTYGDLYCVSGNDVELTVFNRILSSPGYNQPPVPAPVV